MEVFDSTRSPALNTGPLPANRFRTVRSTIRPSSAIQRRCQALGLPYRLFGFDSAMSDVIEYARKVDGWMKAGGRELIARQMRIDLPASDASPTSGATRANPENQHA